MAALTSRRSFHNIMKPSTLVLWLAIIAATTATTLSQAADSEPWIITWRPGADAKLLRQQLCSNAPGAAVDAPTYGINCTAEFTLLVNGIAGHFTEVQLKSIRQRFKTSIDSIVRDHEMQIADDFARRQLPEQFNVTWGLDLLDQPTLHLDNIYHYDYNGTGVHVYVLDTGIRTTHTEFKRRNGAGSRAVRGFDAVDPNGNAEDCHGHGTHVAAIVGGNTYGVAKNVTLHAVRVLDCEGSSQVSTLLAGLEWVAQHHQQPGVVHMSIEGGYSSIINAAVGQLVKAHELQVVVSSGNSNMDACQKSPGSTPEAITVAAVDSELSRWALANWGACVDVFAPGVNILSAISSSDDSTGFKTGTSMAAPFATGVVAQYLETHAGASAAEVAQKMYKAAVNGAVQDDKYGYGTFWPAVNPQLPDISATPNFLLQSKVLGQAHFSPSVVSIRPDLRPITVKVALSYRPSAPVYINVTSPPAWDSEPLVIIRPSSQPPPAKSNFTFLPHQWNISQNLVLTARASACGGDFFLPLLLRSADPAFDGALHTIKVLDARPRSGDSAETARTISALPYQDSGDTSSFANNYSCSASLDDTAPDVVYSFTPASDIEVAASTCGSSFDTILFVAQHLSNPASYTCNDDDGNCSYNPANSRVDTSLKANRTYFFVVDGFSGASGPYNFTLRCTSCRNGTASATAAAMKSLLLPGASHALAATEGLVLPNASHALAATEGLVLPNASHVPAATEGLVLPNASHALAAARETADNSTGIDVS